jgi:hypothetical protein
MSIIFEVADKETLLYCAVSDVMTMFKFSYRRWHWTFQVQDYLLYKKNEQTMFNENASDE